MELLEMIITLFAIVGLLVTVVIRFSSIILMSFMVLASVVLIGFSAAVLLSITQLI